MEFRAAPSRGVLFGFGMLAVAVVVEVGLVLGALAQPEIGLTMAGLALGAVCVAPLIGALAYGLWTVLSLRYDVNRDGLSIRWAGHHRVIPVHEITHVLKGRPYAARLSGLRWPGLERGQTRVATDEGEIDTVVLATTPPDRQLLVVTPGVAYAISPTDRSAFIDEFRLRHELGPVKRLAHETRRPTWARLSVWGDRVLLGCVALGLALNVALFVWLAWRYPSLPGEVALRGRFDPALNVIVAGALRPRMMAWQLPAIGLVVIAANGMLAALLHRRSRLAALLLVASAVVMQALIGVVLVQIG